MHSFPSERDRLKYYIGRQCHEDVAIRNGPDYNNPFIFDCAKRLKTYCHGIQKCNVIKNHDREWRFFIPYWNDMKMFCRMASVDTTRFGVQFGDNLPKRYSFCKSRPVSSPCAVLLPLNTKRHWNFKRVPDVPWKSKREELVWRGVTTGDGLRRRYVHALSKNHNVRFNGVVQHHGDWITSPEHRGKLMSNREILRYKYVLSLPGNDVATNLKWLMMQKSVIVMPTPRVEGWLMEGLLKPYVHFVPLDDPEKVDSMIEWMRTHDDICKRIVHNANVWIGTLNKALFTPIPILFRNKTLHDSTLLNVTFSF